MDIQNAQIVVDNWIKKHGVRYFNELTNMAQLTEEVGEVARIIARRYGEQSEKESDKNKDLGEELADVLFVVLWGREGTPFWGGECVSICVVCKQDWVLALFTGFPIFMDCVEFTDTSKFTDIPISREIR